MIESFRSEDFLVLIVFDQSENLRCEFADCERRRTESFSRKSRKKSWRKRLDVSDDSVARLSRVAESDTDSLSRVYLHGTGGVGSHNVMICDWCILKACAGCHDLWVCAVVSLDQNDSESSHVLHLRSEIDEGRMKIVYVREKSSESKYEIMCTTSAADAYCGSFRGLRRLKQMILSTSLTRSLR